MKYHLAINRTIDATSSMNVRNIMLRILHWKLRIKKIHFYDFIYIKLLEKVSINIAS